MREGVHNTGESLEKGAVLRVIIGRCFHRPIDEKRPPHDGVAIDETPVAAVGTKIAIVAHGKKFVGRHNDFVASHVMFDVADPFGTGARTEELIVGGRKAVIQRVVTGARIMHDVRLIQELSIYVHVAIDDFQAVAGQTNHTFNEMLMVIVGILEDNNVAALQRAIREELLVPSVSSSAKNEFVDEQMIPDEKRLLHRL